jgi:hypothetical protein
MHASLFAGTLASVPESEPQDDKEEEQDDAKARVSTQKKSPWSAEEALAALVVAGGDAHGAVHVEAVGGRYDARRLAVQVLADVLPRREGPAEQGAAREHAPPDPG